MYVSKLSFKYDGIGPLLLAGMNGGGELSSSPVSPHWIIGGSADSTRGWEKGKRAPDSSGNKWCIRLGFSPNDVRLLVRKEEEEESVVTGKTKITFILRGSSGSAVIEESVESSKIGFTCRDFVEPKRLLDSSGILDKGALVIDAIIQPVLNSGWSPTASAPSSLDNNLLKMLERNTLTDLVFHLPQKADDEDGRWIFAHKLILLANAPGIRAFFEDEEDPDMITKVYITGASEEVFRRVLRFIYGGGLPERDFLLEHGFELIGVADKYDLVQLKLEVEEALVASRSLTVSTVVEHVLFADAHNCALLREYAMEYFLARSGDVLAIGAFAQLSQSPKLMQELWTAIGRYGVAAANRESMPVYKLRKLLREKKLDVDGSKAMLVARLEGNAGDE